MSFVGDMLGGLLGGLFGREPQIDYGRGGVDKTAQKEADKAQKVSNEAIARRRKRSLLASNIDGGAQTQVKKLMGE